MKRFAAGFLVFTTSIVFAHSAFALSQRASAANAADEAEISIRALYPVYCADENYRNVNQIFAIRKIQETARTATFTFLTQVGTCRDGKLVARRLLSDFARFTIAQNGKARSFSHPEYDLRTSSLSNTILRSQLTIDKTLMLSRNSSETLAMVFYPTGVSARGGFRWAVRVSRASGETTLQMKQLR